MASVANWNFTMETPDLRFTFRTTVVKQYSMTNGNCTINSITIDKINPSMKPIKESLTPLKVRIADEQYLEAFGSKRETTLNLPLQGLNSQNTIVFKPESNVSYVSQGVDFNNRMMVLELTLTLDKVALPKQVRRTALGRLYPQSDIVNKFGGQIGGSVRGSVTVHEKDFTHQIRNLELFRVRNGVETSIFKSKHIYKLDSLLGQRMDIDMFEGMTEAERIGIMNKFTNYVYDSKNDYAIVRGEFVDMDGYSEVYKQDFVTYKLGSPIPNMLITSSFKLGAEVPIQNAPSYNNLYKTKVEISVGDNFELSMGTFHNVLEEDVLPTAQFKDKMMNLLRKAGYLNTSNQIIKVPFRATGSSHYIDTQQSIRFNKPSVVKGVMLVEVAGPKFNRFIEIVEGNEDLTSTAFIQGESMIKVVVDNATPGENNAAIESYSFALGNQYHFVQVAPPTTGYPTYTFAKNNLSGDVEVIVRANDVNGGSTTISKFIEIEPKVAPIVTNISASRPGSGFVGRISIVGTYALLGNTNSVTAKMFIKPVGQLDYPLTGTDFVMKRNGGQFSSDVLEVAGLEENLAYDIKVVVVDSYGLTTTSYTKMSASVPIVFVDTEKSSVGFGRYPNGSKTIDSAYRFITSESVTVGGGRHTEDKKYGLNMLNSDIVDARGIIITEVNRKRAGLHFNRSTTKEPYNVEQCDTLNVTDGELTLNGDLVPILCSGKATTTLDAGSTTSPYKLTASVTFDKPFKTKPFISLNSPTTVPGTVVLGYSAVNVSETGFDIVCYRTSKTNTAIEWGAFGY